MWAFITHVQIGAREQSRIRTGTEMRLTVSALCLIHILSYGFARKPLFRAARDAEKTGRYIVVLRDDVEDQQFDEILFRAVSLSNNKRAYGVIKTVEKAFTLKLNKISLEQVKNNFLCKII